MQHTINKHMKLTIQRSHIAHSIKLVLNKDGNTQNTTYIIQHTSRSKCSTMMVTKTIHYTQLTIRNEQ